MKLDQLFAHWKQIRKDLNWTIDQFADDELTYRPFDTSWPVGDVLLHIAEAEDGWFRYVVKGELKGWPIYPLESYNDIEAIKSLLAEVHGRTETFLQELDINDLDRPVNLPWNDGQVSLGWEIWHVLEHEIHHRGELSLTLGLLGREGLDV